MAKEKKDWTGDKNSVFKSLGASNHTENERQKHDYYATDPKAVTWLNRLEKFNNEIWEPACGGGHISKELEKNGYQVKSTDLVYRGFGVGDTDFLGIENQHWHGDIITNPPFIYAQEFILKALAIVPKGNKVAMFLKIQFLESQERKTLFLHFPPTKVYITCSRLSCAKNGDFKGNDNGAMAYAWYIWEKGFKGDTILKWFN